MFILQIQTDRINSCCRCGIVTNVWSYTDAIWLTIVRALRHTVPLLILCVSSSTSAVIRTYALTKLTTTVTVCLAGAFRRRFITTSTFTLIWCSAVTYPSTIIFTRWYAESAIRIQSISIPAKAFTTSALSILASNWTCWHAEATQIFYMIWEAGASLWFSTKGVNAFFSTNWITDFEVVYVFSIALAARSYSAEIRQ